MLVATLELGPMLLERETAYLSQMQKDRAGQQRRAALAMARGGDFTAAVPGLLALARRPEADWLDMHNLGVAYLLLGDVPQGKRWLRRALNLRPVDSRVKIALAIARWAEGDGAGAVEALGQCASDRRAAVWQQALAAVDPAQAGTLPLKQAVSQARARRVALNVDYLAVQTGLTGGMKIFFQQVNWLAKRGHHVRVLAYGPKPPWVALGAEFVQASPDRLLSDAVQDADVVVSSFWTQNHDLERVPAVTRVFLAQGDSYVWEPESLPAPLQTAVRLSHQVEASLLAVSPALADRVAELYGRRADVIPNGFEATVFYPRSKPQSGPLRIMAVGRDTLPFKGIQDIFECVRLIRERGRECELTWVSPADPGTPGVQCRFYKSPPQEQLAELYAEADVFVSGSRYDAFPLPSLEAMACGTAVVAVDNAGLRTYARDGENCLLVPAGSPGAMADAVLSVADSPELRARLVAEGLRTAASYTWERSSERLEETLYTLWLGDLFVNPPAAAPRETVSLCMIARDEEASIGRCLDSVAGVVDEIVVVDTGSTDRTAEVARQHGARVFSLAWQNDFAAARNQSIEHAKGDWILWLDADEELQRPPDGATLQDVIRANLGAEALLLNIESLMDDSDPTNRIVHSSPRLFRNRRHHRFEGTIHEQIQLPIERAGGRVLTTQIAVTHYGYLPSVRAAKNKGERNLSLLREQVARNPQDSFARFNLGTEYYVKGDFAAARAEYAAAYQTAPHDGRQAQYFSKLTRNLANCHRILGDLAAAQAVIAEGLGLFPDYTDLWLLKGQVEERQGRLGDAIDSYNRCVAMGEAPARYLSNRGVGSWDALIRKGVLLQGAGREAEAVICYQGALALNPQLKEPALRLATLIGQPDVGEDMVTEAEAALGASPFANELLAQAHYLGGRYKRAARFAKEAPDTPNVLVARAAASLADGDVASARRALADVPATASDEAAGLHAIVAWNVGDWAQAQEAIGALPESGPLASGTFAVLDSAIRAAAAAAPTDSADVDAADLDALVAVLERLVNLGMYELFESGLAVFQKQPLPGWRIKVGKLLCRKGFSDLGFDLMIEDVSEAAYDDEALGMMAEVALARGAVEEAEGFLRQAMSCSPRPKTYAPRLAAVLVKAGRAQDAAALLADLMAR